MRGLRHHLVHVVGADYNASSRARQGDPPMNDSRFGLSGMGHT